MGHVLAFAMQKGGVAKTTSTLNIGVILAQRGARVLLIDLDHQANLTEGLGVDIDSVRYSTYEVLLNPEQGVGFATVTTGAGVDLVPSTFDLAGAEYELAGKVGREMLLRKALRQVREQYDYILLDPPPSLGVFTFNALAAADAAIVPCETHPYPYKALLRLEKAIDLARDLNPQLEIGGVFCTKTDRTNLSQTIEQRIRQRYGELMFKTGIPRNISVAEAPAAGEPISVYAPGSPGAQAYQALTTELEERYGK